MRCAPFHAMNGTVFVVSSDGAAVSGRSHVLHGQRDGGGHAGASPKGRRSRHPGSDRTHLPHPGRNVYVHLPYRRIRETRHFIHKIFQKSLTGLMDSYLWTCKAYNNPHKGSLESRKSRDFYGAIQPRSRTSSGTLVMVSPVGTPQEQSVCNQG